ncbi:MAG: Dam family site-specific DNA-(adenine-N6)-methyltransferase [Hyphomicrobiaceae bacterium]|nr:MAG: Dam family site-specific DNA-(adenine-N6)-methyltransferase [Hyphomicrobiaceae bacterium]
MTKPAAPLTSPLKYPGGKRKLFPEVERRFPAGRFKYAEPFWGGGSIGVRLAGEGRATQIVAGEACPPVRAFWEVVGGRSEYQAEFRLLLENFAEQFNVSPAIVFERMRKEMNSYNPAIENEASVAARLFVLNKTCMNGLVRFNAAGEFNVPIGRRQDGSFYRFNPNFEHLDRVSAALALTNFEIHPSWQYVLAQPDYVGWVYYCDPPYTGGFVDYTAEGWSSDDDIVLYESVRNAAQRGARVILSQPDTEWARDCCSSILKGWQVDPLEVGRSINSDGGGRGPVGELLIWNKPRDFTYADLKAAVATMRDAPVPMFKLETVHVSPAEFAARAEEEGPL